MGFKAVTYPTGVYKILSSPLGKGKEKGNEKGEKREKREVENERKRGRVTAEESEGRLRRKEEG